MVTALPPFQELIDREGRDLLGYLMAMAGPQEAEDCFQETLMAALKAYPELSDSSNLRGWLFTIAHRKAIDSHRRKRAEPVPPESLELLAEASRPLTAATGGAGPGDSPDDDHEIWEAVSELPPKQRSAVTLRFAGDLTHREIGLAIGCSEAAARRNVHEAVKSLRGALT